MSEENDSAKDKGEESEEGTLEALLEEERRKAGGYLTRLKYMQADFENYRKRREKELREVEESSLRGLVMTLLSVVDELELAVENAKKSGSGGELLEGVKMVHKKLVSSLAAAGLQRIDCVGKPFDPLLHEAVEKVQGHSGDKDVVLEEIRRGYVFRDRVVRPSMVKVQLAAKTPPRQEAKMSE